MKILDEPDMLQTIDEPLDAFELIRQRAVYEKASDEALYICNISDIINKHQIWKHCLPRVKPFYGKFILMGHIWATKNTKQFLTLFFFGKFRFRSSNITIISMELIGFGLTIV